MRGSATEMFLVASWEQWLALRESGMKVPGGVLAAYDLDAVVDAGDCGMPVINLLSFLDHARTMTHVQRAWEFCRAAAEVWKGRFVFHGCDLFDRIKLDLAFPLMYALNAADVVGQCLREHPAARVRLFPQQQKAFVWDPGERPPDLFNAVAWWQAERMGFKPVPVDGLPPPPAKPSSSSWKASDSPLADPVKKAGRGLASSEDGSPAAGKVCSILSVGAFLDMAEQECALDYAAKNRRADWFVASSDPLDALPRIDPLHLWRLPVAAPELEQELARFKGHALPLVRARLGAAYDVVLDNSHMGFFWDFVADLMRQGAMWYAAGRLLAEGLRPKAVLMGGDHLGSARCLACAFSGAGTACISVQHGGIYTGSFDLPRYQDNANHLVVWNERHAQRLGPGRSKRSIIRVTGSFRADLHGLKQRKPAGGVPGGRPKIVLFSTRLNDCFAQYNSSLRHRQAWLEVVDLCRRHPEWDFVVKSHPRVGYQALHASAACRGIAHLTLGRGKPLDFLVGASAAVMLTELSTVALDAMAAGVPVVWLKAAVVSPEHHDLEEGGAVVVQTVGELESRLGRLLEDEAFRSRVVAEGRAFLEKTLPFTGDEAAARLCDFIDELAPAKSGPAPSPDPTARWLIDLLDLVARAQAGRETWDGFRRQLARLRERGREVDVRRLDDLNVPELGGYILEAAILRPWRREDVVLSMLALRIYRTLPHAIRPALSVLRNYLVHACVEQGKRTPGWRSKILPYVLAPGRLRRKRA